MSFHWLRLSHQHLSHCFFCHSTQTFGHSHPPCNGMNIHKSPAALKMCLSPEYLDRDKARTKQFETCDVHYVYNSMPNYGGINCDLVHTVDIPTDVSSLQIPSKKLCRLWMWELTRLSVHSTNRHWVYTKPGPKWSCSPAYGPQNLFSTISKWDKANTVCLTNAWL